MDRPLDIADVHNVSLENSSNECPHLVASFSCKRSIEVGCAAVQLHHVHNISLKGISLTVQAPNMSGVTLQYASNIHIQLNIVCSLTPYFSESHISIGIQIIKASIVEVISSDANNCSSGFVLQNTSNILIMNTTAMYNRNSSEFLSLTDGTGISLLSTTNATIIDTSIVHNSFTGMVLKDIDNVTAINTTAMHNGYYGMYLYNTTRSSTINTTVMHNSEDGMDVLYTTIISIINTNARYNKAFGILLSHTTRSSITNTTIECNGYDGMYLVNTTIIGIVNTSVMHNRNSGLYLENTTRMTITKAAVMYNGYDGIYLLNTARSFITNTTVMQNGYNGVGVVNSTGINIINASVMYNGYDGVDLLNNSSELDIVYDGMFLVNNAGISIINVTVMNSGAKGITLMNNTRATIIKATVLHNGYHGINLMNSIRISISNTTVMNNGGTGMRLVRTTRTSIINTTAMYSGYSGMRLENTTAIIVKETTVMYNGFDGLYLVNTTGVSIISTTVMHNHLNGIGLNNCTTSNIINTTVIHNGFGEMSPLNTTKSSVKENVTHTLFDEIHLNNMFTSGIGANTTIRHIYDGIYVVNTINISIINTTVMYNGKDGMLLVNATDTNILMTIVVSNGRHGMALVNTIRVSILNTTVVYNMCGGIFSQQTMDIGVTNVTVVGNGNEGIVLYSAKEAHITNVFLTHNGWRREITTGSGDVLSTADPTTLPAVIVLYSSSLHVNGCNITSNNVSAVNAYASNITAYSDVEISNNKAIAGAAFILVHNSILKLTEHSHIHFRNNHAINVGGVFYISDNIRHEYPAYNPMAYPLVASTCFLDTEGGRFEKQLLFTNNSAGYGGDILYGGHVSYGLDGDWNCLLSFTNISNISEDGLSLISSDPSRVCLCNDDGQPDCLIVADPTPHSIYPGQSINISAVVVGQEFGTVAGSVYAQFLQDTSTKVSAQLGTGQKIQFVTQEKCNYLNYTISSSDDMSAVVLILTTDNRRVSEFVKFNGYEDRTEQGLELFYHVYDASALNPLKYSHYPVYIHISFLPCPAGFMLTAQPPFKCDCNQLLQQLQGVQCYIEDQTIGRGGLVWVGISKDDNATVEASEYCSFDYCNKGVINVKLSDPDSQCNYNHSGTLCGGCQPGLSLALGSAQCLQCSNKYLALLIPFALAGPALVFFIKLLDLTISHGTINGLIFYANIVKANEYIFLPQGQTNPLTIFIAWLNLDLGVETCFFNGLTAYTKTWLQFVFPLYIWSIAGLIIILAKYSDRVAKAMGNNSVPVLATLFLLSYAKLFRTIITALSYTMLYSSQGQKSVWSADGNVDYLGPKHAVLFAVAVATLLFLWLPYTLLLFLGQWLHRCHCQLIDHILIKIKPFLDTYYGPLKGKHHYWYGALLLVRAAILLMTALIPANHSAIVNFCVSVSAIVLIYFGLTVHRNLSVAMFDAFSFMNLALLGVSNFFTTTVRKDQSVAAYTLIGIAFIQFLGLVLVKGLSILKRSKRVKAWLHKEQPTEDDWELYEQAALQRERESGTENEDTASIESLSTY